MQLLMARGRMTALNRIQNIDEFVNKAAEYDKANPEGKLEGFLEEVALVAILTAMRRERKPLPS